MPHGEYTLRDIEYQREFDRIKIHSMRIYESEIINEAYMYLPPYPISLYYGYSSEAMTGRLR